MYTSATTIWLIVQVMIGLFPKILRMIEEEKLKQAGRDQVVQAVLRRLEDVSTRAEKARTDARNNLDSGVPDDQFRRD